jgi:hypothetical protein
LYGAVESATPLRKIAFLLVTKKEKRETAMAKMRWYAGCGRHFYSPMGYHYVRLEDGTQIEVHPATYEQQFDAYLERIGVQRTTWSEIMHKAENEWKEYCRVMDAFAENTQQWLDYCTPDKGRSRHVFITVGAVLPDIGEEKCLRWSERSNENPST